MVVFLAHTTADPGAVLAEGLGEDCMELMTGLITVETSLSRSQLYHRLKALQPAPDPLLVTELIEIPKFKGMAPGSLSWLRSRVA